MNELPCAVARRLGPFHVDALVNTHDDTIFYVGNGTGQRLVNLGGAKGWPNFTLSGMA